MQRFNFIVFLAGLALLGYFGWSYLHGSRSVVKAAAVNARVVELEQRFAEAQAARMAADRRVGLLRLHSLDPDMLDERARELLKFTNPHEIVIYYK